MPLGLLVIFIKFCVFFGDNSKSECPWFYLLGFTCAGKSLMGVIDINKRKIYMKFFLILLLIILSTSCSENEFDKYVEKPNEFKAKLEKHITQICNARARVTNMNLKQKNLYEIYEISEIGIRFIDNNAPTCNNEKLMIIVKDYIDEKLGNQKNLNITIHPYIKLDAK
ncbi:MAG: hypothetical protein KDI76_02295 [Xanthomonadales bacterium]|nr:hypothetical protein [Xanthomonadales bacterium]